MDFETYVALFNNLADRPGVLSRAPIYRLFCEYGTKKYGFELTPETTGSEDPSDWVLGSRKENRDKLYRFFSELDIEFESKMTERVNSDDTGKKLYDLIRKWPKSIPKSVDQRALAVLFHIRKDPAYKTKAIAVEREILGKAYWEFPLRLRTPKRKPATKPSIAKTKLTKTIDPRWRYKHEGIERMIALKAEGHEAHPICHVIKELIGDHSSRSILISGGPGYGKTATIAECVGVLSNALKKDCDEFQIIPFFFLQDSGMISDNEKESFWLYILDQLFRFYGDPLELWDSSIAHERIFESMIFGLSEAGIISIHHPLVIIIDALDECVGYEPNDKNPLGFPVGLPEGVYIVQSVRKSDTVARDERSSRSSFHTDILMLSENGHSEVAKAYALRMFDSEPHLIAVEHRFKFRVDDLEDLVDRLLKDCSCNFMILRGILHDPDLWGTSSAWRSFPQSLNEYYAGHLDRMTSKNSIALDAIIKLSALGDLLRQVIVEAFANRMTNGDVERALTQWISQGLVIEDISNDAGVVVLYHRTFREFLAENLKKPEFVGAIQAAKTRLVPDASSAVTELSMVSSARARSQLAQLIVILSKLAKDAATWRTALLNIKFWELGSKDIDGILPIVKHVSVVKDVGDSRSDYEEFYVDLCGCLQEWASSGKLIGRDREVLSYADIRSHIGRTHYSYNDGSITLVKYMLGV